MSVGRVPSPHSEPWDAGNRGSMLSGGREFRGRAVRIYFCLYEQKLQKPLVGVRGRNWNAVIQTDWPWPRSQVC